jgi:hypothetical protein
VLQNALALVAQALCQALCLPDRDSELLISWN